MFIFHQVHTKLFTKGVQQEKEEEENIFTSKRDPDDYTLLGVRGFASRHCKNLTGMYM